MSTKQQVVDLTREIYGSLATVVPWKAGPRNFVVEIINSKNDHVVYVEGAPSFAAAYRQAITELKCQQHQRGSKSR